MGAGGSGSTSDIRLIGPPMAPPVDLMRWLMQRNDIAFQFQPRAAGLHAFQQRRLKVTLELPLMLTPDGPIGGLRPTLAWVLRQSGKAPPTGALYDQMVAGLFPGAVQLFYAHMLPHPHALIGPSVAGVPFLDRMVVTLLYPLWRRLLFGGLKLEEFSSSDGEVRIAAVFDALAEALLSQPFLSGDEMGVFDLVFATLASPVLLPPGHPATLPALSTLPAEFARIVARFRAHPAGQHALSLYRDR